MHIVRVSSNIGLIELCMEKDGKSLWDYKIPLSDIMVRRGLIRWVGRISKEEWVTKEHISQLIELSHALVNSKMKT